LVAVAAVAALALGVAAARADGPPIVIPVAVQFQDFNPCTGELDTVSLTGIVRVHEFYNEAGDGHHWNVTVLTDVETSAGFSGLKVQSFVHNADGPFAPREEETCGRVDFVLVDLTSDPVENVVDREDVDYAKRPRQVAEAWQSSVALTPERPYRVFFHVYDRTGVNLVAYDRRDFTCESKGA
jgi:hypothetical protein